MISVLEIGTDQFHKYDNDRRMLQKERRIECSKYLHSYDLILYSSHNKESHTSESETDSLTLHHIGGNKLLFPLRTILLARSIIRSKKIDVLSAIDPLACGFVVYILKFLYNIPVNIQLHFDYFSNYYWKTYSVVSRIIYKYIMEFVTCHSDSIRVVSISTKLILDGKYNNEKLVETIPTPVNIFNLHKTHVDTGICSTYRVSPNTKLLLFVGRLEDSKDIGTLLRAFDLIRKGCQSIKLLIVGMGSKLDELKEMAISLGVSEDVIYVGSVSYELLPSYYSSSDIFVIASKHEGRSTVLIEAALFKMPIVATRFTGTQDSIIDGRTGFVVDIGDFRSFAEKVLVLLKDQDMSKQFGEKGYEYVTQQMDKTKSMKSLVELWERTAKSN